MVVYLFKNYARLIYRQPMYWMSCLFVIWFAAVLYNVYYVDHLVDIIWSETSVPPRHFLSVLGGFPLVLAMLIGCFVCIRTISRDSQYRIEEVVLSKPFGNYIHSFSLTIALTLFMSLPIVLFVFGVQALSVIQKIFGFQIVESFEIVSVLIFLCVTTIFSMNVISLICYAAYHSIRNSILSLICCFGIVLFLVFLLTKVSFSEYTILEFLPLVGDVGSDMIFSKLTGIDILRIVAYFTLSLALIHVVSFLLWRADIYGKKSVLLCMLFGALSLSFFGSISYAWYGQLEDRNRNWYESELVIDETLIFDIESITGNVEVDPSNLLDFDLKLSGRVDQLKNYDEVLVRLNPGFKIVGTITVNGASSEFQRIADLVKIKVESSVLLQDAVEIALSYQGKPNFEYGFLDSAIKLHNVPYWDQLFSYYGIEKGIFDRRFVALMSETYWLPHSVLPLDYGLGYKEFINIDMSIVIPWDWNVIASGSVSASESSSRENGQKTVNLKSDRAIAGVNIFAGPFSMVSSYLDDIQVTLELHAPRFLLARLEDIEDYEQYVEAFENWFVEMAQRAESDGYELPCATYRFVAVPSTLRLTKGGTFMNSAITGSCIYLLREHGLFATKFDRNFPDYGENADYSWVYSSWTQQYFQARLNGGNIEMNFANHFLDYRIGTTGNEGEYLLMILSYLQDLVWNRRLDRYSQNAYFPRAMNVQRMSPSAEIMARWSNVYESVSFRHTLTEYMKRYTRHLDVAEVVSRDFLENMDVVDIAIRNSLKQLSTSDSSPIYLEAIRLRCATEAYKIYDAVGREGSIRLLNELTRNYSYSNLSIEQFYELAESIDIPMRMIMAGWYDSSEGFTFNFSSVSAIRYLNSQTQEPYYQVTFRIENNGDSAGVFSTRLFVSSTDEVGSSDTRDSDLQEYDFEMLNSATRERGPTIIVPPNSTKRIDIVSQTRPLRIELRTRDVSYNNRVSLEITENTLSNMLKERDPTQGTFDSSWSSDALKGIILDDAELIDAKSGWVIDYQKNFERFDFAGAWGTDRKSFVYTERTRAKISLKVQVPETRKWEMQYFVPDIRGTNVIGRRSSRMLYGRPLFDRSFVGDYEVVLKSNTHESTNNTFAISKYDAGWVSIGSADLHKGNLELVIEPIDGTRRLFFDALRLVEVAED